MYFGWKSQEEDDNKNVSNNDKGELISFSYWYDDRDAWEIILLFWKSYGGMWLTFDDVPTHLETS